MLIHLTLYPPERGQSTPPLRENTMYFSLYGPFKHKIQKMIKYYKTEAESMINNQKDKGKKKKPRKVLERAQNLELTDKIS